MSIKLRENCDISLLVPTSMGVRITPADRQPVHTSYNYVMQTTSAESNVLGVAAALGMPTKVLTAFVKGSPISMFIKRELGARHIAYEGPEIEQGGPWGYRHQFNIADSGYGVRGPRVHNDRAGEVARILKASDFDLDRIFVKEGVQILHMSGLFASLSPETGILCRDLARIAKKSGTAISFDLNHRASFWEGREKELREIFSEIASLADILMGNEEDFQLCLGIKGPEAGGKDITAKIDSFKGMVMNVKAAYPNVTVYANTLRQVLSANVHLWGAMTFVEDKWNVVEPREIHVLDRIGGGDGFAAGLLYAILKGWDPDKWVQFGWASGALATTVFDDFATPADEEQIWSIWQGNARVKR